MRFMFLNLADRYLIRQLGLATLMTASIVTAIIWLTQALRLVELVLDRGAPGSMLMWMLVLTVPTFLGLIVPLALAAAVMFIYYRLLMESELVVLRAAGMSNWQLARPALILSLAFVALGYFISFELAPAANRELSRQEFVVKNDYALVLLRDGMFNKLGEGRTVYVRERIGTQEMSGLMFHDESKKNQADTLFAKRGILEQDEDGSRIVLLDGIRQQKNLETGQVTELNFKQYTIDLAQFGRDYSNRWVEPRERTLGELLDISNLTDKEREANLGKLRSELHQRLATPILAFAFPLLALAVLLTAAVNRRGMTKRLLIGALAITLWQVVVMTGISMIQKDSIFVTVLYVAVFAPLPVFIFLLVPKRRVQRQMADGA